MVFLAIASFLANELLLLRAREAVDRAIQDNVERATFLSEVAALNFRALSLDQRDGFSENEAVELIDTLASLNAAYLNAPGIPPATQQEYREKLTFAVETTARNFGAAGRGDLVAQVQKIVPVMAERSTVFTEIIVQDLGRELVGAPGGADTWRDLTGSLTGTYERYKSHAQRARETGFPELYLVFELVMGHMADRPDQEIRELAADISSLNDADTSMFVQLMQAHATEEFTKSPDAASKRIADRFRGFLQAHGDAHPILQVINVAIRDEGGASERVQLPRGVSGL